MQELWWIIQTIAGILAIACILRIWGHKVQLLQRDILMHFSCVVTDWLVLPLRKLIPLKPRGTDWAAVVATFLIGVAMVLLFNLIRSGFGSQEGFAIDNVLVILLRAAGWLLTKALYLVIFVVIAQAILSWVNPNAPVAPTLNLLTRPLLAPIRKLIPPIGGIDFSPVVLILVVQVLIMFAGRLPNM